MINLMIHFTYTRFALSRSISNGQYLVKMMSLLLLILFNENTQREKINNNEKKQIKIRKGFHVYYPPQKVKWLIRLMQKHTF